jgi:predicted AAA+ superfamily ATPase
MNITQLITVTLTIILFSNLALSEQIIIKKAHLHPYKNLLERTNKVKIYYHEDNKDNKTFICNVKVLFNTTVWLSTNKKVSKESFNNNPLISCLSKASAEQALLQSYLQFGRGL